MNTRRTNCHMHVFVTECAPPNFLRVNSSKVAKLVARPVKWVLESPSSEARILKINKFIQKLDRKQRIKLGRYASFLSMGAQECQQKVFEHSLNAAKNYDTNPRLIAHTLDMDYMDTDSVPLIDFDTQLYDVMKIKRFYPDNIFPFVGVDPRARSGVELVNWVKKYFNTGVKSNINNEIIPYCSGIKIYPAHGFFPFDPGLDELYKYAEAKEIPLMFHCTRIGSQYIGKNIQALIPKEPSMLMPEAEGDLYNKAKEAKQEIYDRIARYYDKKTWILNSKIGANEFACDLFSHPQNYVPIMCKYPNLKICLAHMGGNEEVEFMHLAPHNLNSAEPKDKELKEIWETDEHNWAFLIQNLMKEHMSLCTDISSTITHLDEHQVIANIINWLNETDNKGNKLGDRVLFGTDFFMTEPFKAEVNLYELARNTLGDWFNKMSITNINNYLP